MAQKTYTDSSGKAVHYDADKDSKAAGEATKRAKDAQVAAKVGTTGYAGLGNKQGTKVTLKQSDYPDMASYMKAVREQREAERSAGTQAKAIK